MEENKKTTEEIKEQNPEEAVVSEETVVETASQKRNEILLISAIAAGVIIVAVMAFFLIKGFVKPTNKDNVLSGESTTSDVSTEEDLSSNVTEGNSGTNNSTQTGNSSSNSTQTGVSSGNSTQTGVSSNNSPTDNSPDNSQQTGTSNTPVSSGPQGSSNTNTETALSVTVTKFVAPNICIVGGSCPKGTQSLVITGDKVEQTTVVPYAGEKYDYFITQVKCTGSGDIKVMADSKESATRYVTYDNVTTNLMTKDEYRPVIGKNGFGHFYSALVGYSYSTANLDASFKSTARRNIQDIVNIAKDMGAEPIFLIIPSSAEIYPETLPEGYTKTTGESLYQAFYDIATSCGAKIIYPIDTMKNHKNDGVGYQLYQHTDSHWSTYGAYWGTYDLFTHIAKDFPAAKPRTLSEMGFYTKEFYAGDNLFNLGIELTKNNPTFKTNTTKMRELSTLYKLKTFENTLSGAYHSLLSPSLYLSEANSKARVTDNPQGDGLPNAVIMRDSFSKVSFDMVSDRFDKVYWQQFDNYTVPINDLAIADADYLIYMYSERNLLKLMLNNSAATILNLR